MRLAKATIATFKGAGVYAVEMFLLPDDATLVRRVVTHTHTHTTTIRTSSPHQVNEVAPRVHNSGHHTIEACATSQFEQHIRAVRLPPRPPTP